MQMQEIEYKTIYKHKQMKQTYTNKQSPLSLEQLLLVSK